MMVTRPEFRAPASPSNSQRQSGSTTGQRALSGVGGVTVSDTGEISLEPTGVTADTYGDATNVPQFEVDAEGRVVDAVDVAIAFPVPAVTFGTGAPGGTPANGALYFDDTAPALYVGYVGRAGAWVQFS